MSSGIINVFHYKISLSLLIFWDIFIGNQEIALINVLSSIEYLIQWAQ